MENNCIFVLTPQNFVFQKNSAEMKERLAFHYDRLVFVLIDALRSDFVLPFAKSDLPQMKFVSGLVESGHALGLSAKAHPPTVTMPRIKVITLTLVIDQLYLSFICFSFTE